MKIHNRVSEEGGTLVTVLIVCVVVALMLTAYLSMLSYQHRFSQRSQVWNNCIPMCEAGVEEALAHMNYALTTNFASDGWWLVGSTYRKERALNGGTFRMAIDNLMPPTITVTGILSSPIQGNIMRAVRVKTKLNWEFPNAILAKGTVTLNGNGMVDSFNSTNSLESTNGQYSAALRTDHATVATTATASSSISVGNSTVFGSVGTGPGGTASIQNNGNVGDIAWNNDPTKDGTIEPSRTTDDVNVYISSASLPSPYGPALPPAPGIVGLTLYKYILTGGDYMISDITLATSDKMLITGKCRIYVTAGTSVSGMGSITVATNSSVEWYTAGNVNIAGSGVINSSGLAKNFAIIGLNTCTSVSYSGTSSFIGTVYAPNATVTLNGTSDAFGALVGKTVTLMGTMNFHYDEALKGDPTHGKYLAASWQEL
jgi:hypothetical protein